VVHTLVSWRIDDVVPSPQLHSHDSTWPAAMLRNDTGCPTVTVSADAEIFASGLSGGGRISASHASKSAPQEDYMLGVVLVTPELRPSLIEVSSIAQSYTTAPSSPTLYSRHCRSVTSSTGQRYWS
jgi:hypothetical protein